MLGPRRCSSSPWVRPWAEKVRISQAPVMLSSPSLRCVWGAPGPKQRKSSAFRSSLAKHLCTKGGQKSDPNGSQRTPNHPKIDPKKSPKSPQNRSRGGSGPPLGRKLGQTCLLDAIWWPAGGLWGSFWGYNGAKGRAKGAQREPNGVPRGAKGGPKGSQERGLGGRWALQRVMSEALGWNTENHEKTSYFIGSGRLGGVPSGPFLEPQRSFFGQLGAL